MLDRCGPLLSGPGTSNARQTQPQKMPVGSPLTALADDEGARFPPDMLSSVVYPEMALTTFFPRWYVEDEDDLDLDHFYETEMPGPQTSRLFNRAQELRIGFAVGYCELTPGTSPIAVQSSGCFVACNGKVRL